MIAPLTPQLNQSIIEEAPSRVEHSAVSNHCNKLLLDLLKIDMAIAIRSYINPRKLACVSWSAGI
jgi:hypothetical protein